MRKAKDFRAQARKALEGRYWWAVLAALIAAALGGTASCSATGPGVNYGIGSGDLQEFSEVQLQLDPAVTRFILIALGALVSIAALIGIALFIIGGAVELGYNRYNIRLYESQETPPMGTLFSRFAIFGRALWLRVLMALKILAWTLLFVVPGIIAAYRYAMAPYIMAENPELTASEAIEQSKAMMAGNKGRLFCLQLSFIGWYILAGLTCGIGYVFLMPYVKSAETAFYMERSGRLPLEAAAAPQQATVPAQEPVLEAAPEGGPEQL